MNTEHARMTHGVALRAAAAGFAALLLPGLAAAAGGADDKGWFAQAGAGVSSSSIADSTVRGGAGPAGDLVLVPEVDDDVGFFLGVGYDFGLIRVEGEYNATTNDAEKYRIVRPASVTLPLDGEAELNAIMLNAYMDFPLGEDVPWGLFVGAGIGRADLALDLVGPPLPGAPSIPLIDDEDSVTAYQLTAGASYAFTPTLGAFLRYRYLDLGDVEGKDTRGLAFETEVDYDFWELGLQLRF